MRPISAGSDSWGLDHVGASANIRCRDPRRCAPAQWLKCGACATADKPTKNCGIRRSTCDFARWKTKTNNIVGLCAFKVSYFS